MATYNEIVNFSAEAASDLSSKQFHVLTVDSSGKVDALDGLAGSLPLSPPAGVLANKPVAGEQAIVSYGGILKVAVGSGGITAGKEVMVLSGADAGKCGDFSSPAAGNAVYTVGVALESAASGDIAKILWAPRIVSN
ncbi:hypothetical protein D6779_11115 [Candidatus Parcubacteria bacterium]|nr:MAG: hypothetical protein D6779_11115 [Candidatus Parcubacteria bacterium]